MVSLNAYNICDINQSFTMNTRYLAQCVPWGLIVKTLQTTEHRTPVNSLTWS